MERTGTLVFVLSDIEGSTRLAQALGEDAFAERIDRYREALGGAFRRHNGIVQQRADELLGIFARAADAVAAALDAQRALGEGGDPGLRICRARMGVHAGDAAL